MKPSVEKLTGEEQRRAQESRDLQFVRDRLQSWTTRNAAALRARADVFSSNAAQRFSKLGGKLNQITGYEEIEALKLRVVENEARIREARLAARAAKKAYDEAVSRRSNSQREVNDLLQRKSSWNDADVSRFTQLVRQDHLFEREEIRSKEDAARAEDAVERELDELMRAILARYHEEQIWSDKIRSASTYGSLAALALNLVVFVLAIVIVEPWKRQRLVQTFQSRVVKMHNENQDLVQAGMTDLSNRLAKQEDVISRIVQVREAADTPNLPASGYRDETLSPDGSLSGVVARPTTPMDVIAKLAHDRGAVAVVGGATILTGILGWILGSYYG
ncbi:hypothetical protein BD410DRAFT_729514 [Rickenella mellea]|uniref:Sensitive to high expression protein 9, mitochondrial n=1 Tax=Rickenella mellea TaxID=50990 RepID=A0A4Y7PRJ3_9AGAM|nr:hypothetical protein BD410DRAFT_729514 [Rickenella mellea]